MGGDLLDAVDQEAGVDQSVHILLYGAMIATRRLGVALPVLLHGDIERGQVVVDPPVANASFIVPAPAALAGNPKAGMGHQDHYSTAPTQSRGGVAQDGIEWVDILDTEEEGRCVEFDPTESRDQLRVCRIAEDESPYGAVMFPCECDQLRTRIHPGIMSAGAGYVRGENTGAAAHVQDLLSLAGL